MSTASEFEWYGEFPDIKAMANALSQALEMLAEQALKIHDLEAKIEGMKIQGMTQTGGFQPRNRRLGSMPIDRWDGN